MACWQKTAVVSLLALVMSGCVYIGHPHGQRGRSGTKVVMEKHGPPPHAPAHGHRHKHHGVDLLFDTGLGVYVVVGHAHHYFHDGRYYRLHESGWRVSAKLDGHWVEIKIKDLPRGLVSVKVKKAKRAKKEKRHEHRHHPASHDD